MYRLEGSREQHCSDWGEIVHSFEGEDKRGTNPVAVLRCQTMWILSHWAQDRKFERNARNAMVGTQTCDWDGVWLTSCIPIKKERLYKRERYKIHRRGNECMYNEPVAREGWRHYAQD